MTAPVISQNTLDFVRDIRAEQLRRKQEQRNVGFGINLPNSVSDVSVPFPEDWLRLLREASPVSEVHSWLLPYYYRAGERWVLYDALPAHLIPDSDDVGLAGMMTGADFFRIMRGPKPSERTDFQDVVVSPISDVQHEMYRLHRAYARPFWVLQGPAGGHQVAFSPQQSAHLLSMGLPEQPPRIGSLEPCPFDNRVTHHLRGLNRLHQMQNSMDRLRESGSREWADAEEARMQKEVRLSECRLIEEQMTPLVDMAMSLVKGPNTRSEHRDQIVQVKSGAAAEAHDAYQRYQETGDYSETFKDLTGIGR